MVIPGHITKGFDHVVIKVCTPETSYSFIMQVCGFGHLILYRRQVVQEIVHLAQVFPRPATLLAGIPGIPFQESSGRTGGTIIGILVACPGYIFFTGQKVLQETVQIKFHITFRHHKGIGTDLVLWLTIQKVLTRHQREGTQGHYNIFFSFHLPIVRMLH